MQVSGMTATLQLQGSYATIQGQLGAVSSPEVSEAGMVQFILIITGGPAARVQEVDRLVGGLRHIATAPV